MFTRVREKATPQQQRTQGFGDLQPLCTVDAPFGLDRFRKPGRFFSQPGCPLIHSKQLKARVVNGNQLAVLTYDMRLVPSFSPSAALLLYG